MEKLDILKFGFSMVQKQDGHLFVWFSNVPYNWKTKFLASLDHFIYKHDFYIYLYLNITQAIGIAKVARRQHV